MRKKLLLFRNGNLFPKLAVLLFFTWIVGGANATTYYWIGGAGDWITVSGTSHWSLTSGGTPVSVGTPPPGSLDDVIFDANSGFTAAALGNRVNFSNSAVVRNISVNANIAPEFYFPNTAQFFDIWGNADFQSGMNFTNFTCKMRYFVTTASPSKTVNTNGNTFTGAWKFDAGTNGATLGTVAINGNFKLRNGFEINSVNNADKVVITGNPVFEMMAAFNPYPNPGNALNVVKGEVYFDGGFTATMNSYQFHIGQNGKLYSQANGSVNGLYNSGYVNLNYTGTNPTYSISLVDIHDATSSSILDFRNTTINITGAWNYGRGLPGNYSILSTGSMINFKSTASTFYTYNYSFGDITIEPSASTTPFYITGGVSNVVPVFDDFVIKRNTYYNQQGSPSTFTFTSNTYKVHPGVTISMQHAVARIKVNNTCDITGTCEKPIKFITTNFEFIPGTTVLSNYIFTEGITAVGPVAPYNAGGNSRVITGASTGWNFGTAPGRTLIWVGPVPSNIANQTTYNRWVLSANWRDKAIDPGATGPGFAGGTPACPPTFQDSVIIPNDSYILADSVSVIYSSGVNFIGTNRIYGASNMEWEIYAGLTFSPNTTNSFLGTVHFRNNKTYECKIATSNVPFQSGVIMNPINISGSWRLTNGDLIALNLDTECDDNMAASGSYSFRIYNGHFHTGSTACSTVGSYHMRLWGLASTGGAMSWYGSDIVILGSGNYGQYSHVSGILNCGISHLKLDYRSTVAGSTQSSSLGGYLRYYKVSVLSSAGVSTQFSHQVGTSTDTIAELYVDGNVVSAAVVLGGTLTQPTAVRKMLVNSPGLFFGVSWGAFPNLVAVIDSLEINGNAYFHQRLRIRSYVKLTPGKQYVFHAASSPAIQMDLLGATSAISYSSCVPMPTSYGGATANFNGTCSDFIKIDNGFFTTSSPFPINAQYLNITNNYITGGTGLNSNGVLTGTTTNWSITVSPPRKLRWVDGTTIANHSGNWNEAAYWEQVLPVYAGAPQCPPTKNDTIVFDNGSFSNIGQRFNVSTPMEVASMYWNNTSGTPAMSGAGLITIYGSLRLPSANSTSFMNLSTSNFEFRGVPTAQFPSFTIRTNGQRLRGTALFSSTSDNARWDLLDSLALHSSLTLNRGKLHANGFPMYSVISGFTIAALNATDLRTIDITNSNIYATMSFSSGGFWRVSNSGAVTNTTVNASGSKIYVSSDPGGNIVFNGGGYRYHNVYLRTGAATCVMNITNGDEFHYIEARAGGAARIQGGPNLKANRIKTLASTFILSSTQSIIDTMELLGATSSLLSSNRFRKIFDVAPGTTFVSGANEVQWFSNECPVNLIGTASSNIQMYSSVSGVPAYLRKDSATVCADFIYMKDTWGIGNGNNPAACNSFASTNVNTNCAPSPANAWIISSCDTITDDNSSCGQWMPTAPNRGRAAFTAGGNANDQSGNAGWDYRPYPPVPSIQLASSAPSICVGQSVPLTISGIGAIPFYMDYTDNHGNTYYVNVTSAAQLTSYNASTNAFTYSTTVSPTVSTTYLAGVIAIERCFNNISPVGTGTLAITVNQYPAITNAGSPIEICSGNSGAFVPTTSIPASVSWTSPVVGGITGHSTTGSTNINETLTSSNSSPTTITYTLTPSAAGCVGTPVTQNIVVNPLPNVVSGATQSLDCNNPTVNVSVTSSTPGVNYAWSGPSIVSGGSASSATVNAVGSYTCVVTNPTTGCTRNGSVAVNFAPDIALPVISCPVNVAVNTAAASCNASVVTLNPTISDNCSVSRLIWAMTGATSASSPVSGINYVGTQTFNLGTTTITYTAYDPTGNLSTCSFPVTVTDNVLPTISCPANVNAFTTLAGCNRSVLTSAPLFSDNCGVNRVTWALTGATSGTSPATGVNMAATQTFNLGVTTVTYTVVDNSGNSATCNFTVTFQDTVDPQINCPAAISANTSAVSCSASVLSPNPSVSDNCTLSTLTWAISGATSLSSPLTGINQVGTQTFNLGISTVTYTATDASGNVSTCSYTVTITDNVLPTITCPGNQNVNTDNGVCTATIATPNPAIGDNCSVNRLTYTITGATTAVSALTGINHVGSQPFNLGTSTVTYTVMDAAGNSAVCSFNVVVSDAQLPTVNCPSNISVNTSSGSCDASVVIPVVSFSDNCTVAALTWIMTGATVAVSPSSGINQVGTQTFNSGVTAITYTVRDASNNTSTCSFTVTITDATPPVAPILVDVMGQCSATAPIPVANDNCSGFVNGTTSDPLTYNTQGTFVIHWTFTDAAGNVTTANQTVIVDNSLPPTPPVLATLVGECSVTVPVPSATTGCSGAISGTTSDPLIYNNQGTYTVTWTFDDGMGNVVTAPQTVIIDDITPPVTPTVPAVSDECSVVLTAPTTTDNCAGTITGTTTNPTSYSSQGTFNVVWTFNDGNGNTTSVIQTVTIADVTNPAFSNCPSNLSVSNEHGDCGAIVSWTPPTANDNCAGYTVTSSHNSGDFFNLGITTVTYTVTDVAGNTSTCTFDVEVTDNEAPVITGCPSNISVSNDPSLCSAVVNWVLPTPNDNCPGVTMTSTHNSGDLFAAGTTTVTYTATDASGNTSTCTFDVTVTDNEAPIFAACPSDITVNNDPGICGAVVNWPPMNATDNCSNVTVVGSHNQGNQFPVGTTTVTYTATDDNGNSVTCSFDITVIDAEDPVLSGLNDLSVCEGSTVNWNVTATDNCAVQSLTSNYTSGTVLPLGNTWVVYTAVDASGNTVVDSFMVNVFASASVSMELQPNADICVGNNVGVNILNPVPGAIYTWEFNGTVVGTGTQLTLSEIQITQNGTYSVTSDLPGGCISYGSINVEADFCDLIIPEAVTPNADGNNDTWYIENLENYQNTTVQIVNRWGAIVFESEDYKNDWNGISQNKMNIGEDELPEGTFYYVLVIGGDSSSKFYHKVYTGYIYLKRN